MKIDSMEKFIQDSIEVRLEAFYRAERHESEPLRRFISKDVAAHCARFFEQLKAEARSAIKAAKGEI